MRHYIDKKAVIGRPPEHRDYRDEEPLYSPKIYAPARIEAYVTVDRGTARHTVVEQGTWLMKHVHVGHDCQVGRNVEIATGAILAGHVTVEDDARIGLGAVILPYRTIGKGARVGAGAVVTKDVPAGEVWAGNPARKMQDMGGERE